MRDQGLGVRERESAGLSSIFFLCRRFGFLLGVLGLVGVVGWGAACRFLRLRFLTCAACVGEKRLDRRGIDLGAFPAEDW